MYSRRLLTDASAGECSAAFVRAVTWRPNREMIYLQKPKIKRAAEFRLPRAVESCPPAPRQRNTPAPERHLSDKPRFAASSSVTTLPRARNWIRNDPGAPPVA